MAAKEKVDIDSVVDYSATTHVVLETVGGVETLAKCDEPHASNLYAGDTKDTAIVTATSDGASVAGTTTGSAAATEDNHYMRMVEILEAIFRDPFQVTGYIQKDTGDLVSNTGFLTTPLLPIDKTLDLILDFFESTSVAGVAFYNSSSEFISNIDAGGSYTKQSGYTIAIENIPDDASYIKISRLSDTDTYKVYQGIDLLSAISIYSGDIGGGRIVKESISTNQLEEYAITETKTTFFDQSRNLFDIDADDVSLSYYIAPETGILYSNTSYNTTGYVRVSELTEYTASYMKFIAWFDVDKNYISGSTATTTTQTSPEDAVYFRGSVVLAYWDEYIIEEGDSGGSWVAYGFTLKDEYMDISSYIENSGQCESILGKEGSITTQDTLADGSTITITDFPYFLKKGLSMSAYMELTLVTSISIGKGYAANHGMYFTVDDTNIYHYYNNVLQSTTAHGLTISTFLKISFYIDDDSVAYLILQSLTGTFETTYQLSYEMAYSPFLSTTGQALSDVTLTCTSKEFRHPVWAFGDSYFSVTTSRWTGIMKSFGYWNYLINGLSGITSATAYDDLTRCLTYGTPKYLLWCLGMNDTEAEWATTYAKVVTLCEENDIILILGTIPTVPSISRETIRTTILASDIRYVDFYKAVGADSAGAWYADYIDTSDYIHPAALGAKALATQVLVDFPEIMQYGKTSD